MSQNLLTKWNSLKEEVKSKLHKTKDYFKNKLNQTQLKLTTPKVKFEILTS